MTTPRSDGVYPSKFSEWVQTNPNLDSKKQRVSCTDIDLAVQKYAREVGTVQRLLLIELKVHGAEMEFSQVDTLSLLDALCKAGNGTKYEKVPNSDEYFVAEYYGVHLVELDVDDPKLATSILWDGKDISLETLERLLRFELDPCTLEPLAPPPPPPPHVIPATRPRQPAANPRRFPPSYTPQPSAPPTRYFPATVTRRPAASGAPTATRPDVPSKS